MKIIYYKICDRIDGEFKTLFHPSEIGRYIPIGEWVEATEKRVRDGSGDNWYISGWHVMETLEEATTYLKRFTYIAHKVIAECICDRVKKKPSPNNVWLSNKIKLNGNYTEYCRRLLEK